MSQHNPRRLNRTEYDSSKKMQYMLTRRTRDAIDQVYAVASRTRERYLREAVPRILIEDSVVISGFSQAPKSFSGKSAAFKASYTLEMTVISDFLLCLWLLVRQYISGLIQKESTIAVTQPTTKAERRGLW